MGIPPIVELVVRDFCRGLMPAFSCCLHARELVRLTSVSLDELPCCVLCNAFSEKLMGRCRFYTYSKQHMHAYRSFSLLFLLVVGVGTLRVDDLLSSNIAVRTMHVYTLNVAAYHLTQAWHSLGKYDQCVNGVVALLGNNCSSRLFL